ncbi:uncharacterized protein N7459_000938 [Penicillium hispanicum]|uniref:uncharacterized protein n=1 Tax=Penicillium hispanicum TaxID=1080232 RepID=UPI002541975A|nr:uncharacterized protein N7459_000938 [Penicillium hispanicum]KAJ5594730.1 hypothetical protein N7459_000938 [Penicillium hispanicum]
MQSTWIETLGGSGPSAELARTLGFQLVEVGTVVPSRIRKRPSKGPSQGQAFWNSGYGPFPLSLLVELYDQSPGSKFIYEAFAIGNSYPQLMMPVPQATLASLLSSSNVNREQLIAHMVDLLLGLQHMLQKQVADLFATPSVVFISTKPNSNEIALVQWGISNHLTAAAPRDRAAFVNTDDLTWLSPGKQSFPPVRICYISNLSWCTTAEQHKFATSSVQARADLSYGEQASAVFTVALMALAALTVHNNKFDANNFNKLAEALQKNPYNIPGLSVGDVQSTQEVLQAYYGAGGALQEPGLDENTANVFAHMLCAEQFRENIDYLIIKWPTLYEVKNAEPGGPPPEYFEAEC